MQEFSLEIAMHTARFNFKLITFWETYSGEFYIIFFVYYNRFVCWKDRGLHYCMNDIRGRNAYLAINTNARIFHENRGEHCSIQLKN